MTLDPRLAAPAVLCLGLLGRLAAQEAHHHHGETLGRVVFSVSCTPGARTRFERAVALLHSFWYEKAADTFREAVVADTACAGLLGAGHEPVPPAVDAPGGRGPRGRSRRERRRARSGPNAARARLPDRHPHILRGPR